MSALREHQLRLLDLLVEFDSVCTRLGITWWIDSGTLLGAVRHGGFIPWDDDLDVCVLASDYRKIRKLLSAHLSSPYAFDCSKRGQTRLSPRFVDTGQSVLRHDPLTGAPREEKLWIDTLVLRPGSLRLKKASYHAVKDNPSYHPGRCAAVVIDGMEVGIMGQVHPLVAKNYGIDTDVYCAEISFTKLLSCRLPDATYSPLPKYPAVTRDLALICDEAVTVAQAEAVITAAAGKLLRDVKLFDIYRGVGVPEGKKSMAFSLELRADDRTLTDTDSEGVVTKVLNSLKEKLDATLR